MSSGPPALPPGDEEIRVWLFPPGAGPLVRRRAHDALHVILGRQLGLRPAQLRFMRTPHGRLYLADLPDTGLEFSLSYAGGRAALAVTRGRAVGVDLEQLGKEAEPELLEIILSAAEREQYQGLPAALREAAFLRAWVGKEAVLKATGLGFSLDPRLVEVDVDPRRPPELRRFPAARGRYRLLPDVAVCAWREEGLESGPPPVHTGLPAGFQMALAVSEPGFTAGTGSVFL